MGGEGGLTFEIRKIRVQVVCVRASADLFHPSLHGTSLSREIGWDAETAARRVACVYWADNTEANDSAQLQCLIGGNSKGRGKAETFVRKTHVSNSIRPAGQPSRYVYAIILRSSATQIIRKCRQTDSYICSVEPRPTPRLKSTHVSQMVKPNLRSCEIPVFKQHNILKSMVS